MTKDNAVYFLLAFSLDEGKLVRQEEYKDRLQAIAAYDAAENYFKQSKDSLFSEFLADPV